jgi:hypothetical protein
MVAVPIDKALFDREEGSTERGTFEQAETTTRGTNLSFFVEVGPTP